MDITHRQRQSTLPGWCIFLIAMGVAAGLVLVCLRLVGPRIALSSAGTIVALILFWPIVLTVGGFLIGLVASLLAGDDAGAGEAAELGVRGGIWYYTRLWSFRSPLFWGGVLGASISLIALYAYVEHAIIPREALVRTQVREMAAGIKKHRKHTGHFLEARGKTLHEALGLKPTDQWNGRKLIDAWGNPLLYELESDEFSERFRIVSCGWNGRRDARAKTGDDIVAEGFSISEGALTKGLLKMGKEKLIEYMKKKLKTNEPVAPPAHR